MPAPPHTMCSVAPTTHLLPTPAPRVLTLAAYDPAAAEQRANAASLSADAGAPAPASEPIDAAPLAASAPKGNAAVPLAASAPNGRAEPPWIRQELLPYLRLRLNLPVHFIDEKTVTATDVDPHQNRFHLPSDGVMRSLRPILTPLEQKAANLLDGEAPKPRPPNPPKIPAPGEERIRKKRRGKDHGGLPVLVVERSAGIRELKLSRWESSRGTVIKGEGYLDFIHRCGFQVDDVVDIWAFKEKQIRLFGVNMYPESPLFVVITTKGQLLPPRTLVPYGHGHGQETAQDERTLVP